MRPSTREGLADYFKSIGHTPEKSDQLARNYIASRDKVLNEMRKAYPEAEIGGEVGPFSVSDLGPWACWMKVDTDVRRDALLADKSLLQRLQEAGESGGWPAYIAIESQETVDRDYEGSWFYRLR